MKVCYTLPVRSSLTIPHGLKFRIGDREFELADKEGSFGTIRVTVDNFPADAVAVVSVGPQGPTSIKVPEDPIWQKLAPDLRTIEGLLALWGVEEILIRPANVEWIAENDDEQRVLEMPGYSISSRPRRSGAPLDLVVRSFFCATALRALEVPLNFARRGVLNVAEERFIEAVYDLFFCLEALFGHGAVKSAALVKAFLDAPGLIAAIERTRNEPGSQMAEGRSFSDELHERYLSQPAEAVIRRLVSLRGRLHHYSQKRAAWNPGDQRAYEVDALMLQWICHHAVGDVVLPILFREKEVESALSSPVTTLDGRKVRWQSK